MSTVFQRGPGWATRAGDTLTGELSYRADGKKVIARTWLPAQFDQALTAWFTAASDGERVEIYVDVSGDGQPVQVRMARPPLYAQPVPDPERLRALETLGGGANPYTFIPTLPRAGLPPPFADAPPAPHGVIDAGTQWSGWLALRLVAQTPLLLPDPEAAVRDADDHAAYPVRLGPDGKPLLHGASVKGALRSAYETVTASRYAVFRGHDRPLAYRRPASKEDRPQVTPARVEPDGHGGLRFKICTVLPVPLYDPPACQGQPARTRRKARAVGRALHLVTTREDGTADWRSLHGREVTCTTREAGQPGKTRTVVDEVRLAGDGTAGASAKRGWLSITGRSIEQKGSERLFVPTGKPTIPVESQHHLLWNAVLASYRDAAEYNEPGVDKAGVTLDRSRHVPDPPDGKVPESLAEGDLVYLDTLTPEDGSARGRGRRAAAARTDVTGVHPVMIGRLPYPGPPPLHESLRPATTAAELSSADRLFGWAPSQQPGGRPAASGYRGRLRIASVRCLTDDWLTKHSPGVTLAPMSSPRPTQFRFYAAADETGQPLRRAAPKNQGYKPDTALRGRKAYWYPSSVPDDYWQTGTDAPGEQIREWQAPEGAKPSQTSEHHGWARPGTEFSIRIFLDAVPASELGPLLWLAAQDGCALRLGGGKPLGFGAVQVSIDWPATQLRTGEALRGSWLSLNRPKPCPRAQAEALITEFDAVTTSDRVIAPAVAAWRKVAAGLPTPAYYPRTRKEPEAETYRWFVANERIADKKVEYGFALPHILEDDQRLPHLPPRS